MLPLGFVLRSGQIPFGQGTPQAREVGVAPARALVFEPRLDGVTPVFEPLFAERVRTRWQNRAFDVVTPAGLIAMKRLAGRPQDLADIAALETRLP
jgi:hypothetical protein